MTRNDIILPKCERMFGEKEFTMIRSNRIILVVYEGFEILDLSGPSSVFATANYFKGSAVYENLVVSCSGGAVCSSAGIVVQTKAFHELTLAQTDTLLVVGGEESSLNVAMANTTLLFWLNQAVGQVMRLGSVCAGTFILAEAGILNDRKATTHWAGCPRLSKDYPAITVDSEALYLQDGTVWTSAGVSTGIDMSLAMVERDWGTHLMGQVAQYLVVYAHRPGNQSQFSTILDAQVAAGEMFPEVIAWIEANLHESIRVADMAEQARMSERTFYRKFSETIGITPSKYLEQLRLNRAKQLLEANVLIKTVAIEVGFRSEAGFRSSFESRFGMSPSAYQRIHARK